MAGAASADRQPVRTETGLHGADGRLIKGQGARLGPLVAEQEGVMEIAKPEKVRDLFRNVHRWRHGFTAWELLFYALWHRTHIQGLAPAGDVFETLSAR